MRERIIEANRVWYEQHASDYSTYRGSDDFLAEYVAHFDADFALMGLAAGALVADCCAGTGLLSRLFAERGCHVTAVDVSPAMLAHVEPPIITVAADATDYLRAHGGFDCVVFGSALHHLWDYEEAVSVALDSLRPEGILYVVAEPVAKQGLAKVVREGEFVWRKLRRDPLDVVPAIKRRLGYRHGSSSAEIVGLYAEVYAHGIDQQKVVTAVRARAQVLVLRESRSMWLRGVKRLVPSYGGDSFTLVARAH
ncbi:MAG TPA: hypothetical protein DEV93_13640 [Chloroflexi bacterium]|nr:hypothetical protein [Chloroflexota bacterium]